MTTIIIKSIGRRHLLLGAGASAALVVIGAAAACRREAATEPPDRGKVLSDLVSIVIVPGYADAATEAKALEASVTALRDAPTAETLAAARASWKKARGVWKGTDAHLFGPADDLALTAGIIDEAPDAVKIEANVAAAADPPLDDAAIQKLGANQRGFGALEALLFDPTKDDAAMLQAFQQVERRRTLGVLVAIDLRLKIEKVRDAWTAPPSDYGGQLSRAGRGSTVYASERQGVDAIVNGLIAAAEVQTAVRLAKPLGIDKTPATPAPTLVESQRSDASIDDILAVLDGIEAVYLGRARSGSGAGLALSAAVADRSPSGDERIRAALTKAKSAVSAIPGPLRTAVVERRDPVIAAHAAAREVKRALVTDVAAALGTSVGFNVTDGD